MSYKKVDNLRVWVQKILPLAYDDSLSYYEVLAKVVVKVNETIEQLNLAEEEIEELKATIGDIVAEYLDSDLEEFKADMLNIINVNVEIMKQEIENTRLALEEEVRNLSTELREEQSAFELDINNKILNINKKINEFEVSVNERLMTIDLEIAKLYADMGQYKHDMDEIFKGLKGDLEKYIDEHVREITRLYVTNPLTGEYENVQNVLNDLARYVTWSFGLTAEQYDNLKLTASEYDGKLISAIEYSARGIIIFLKELYMRMRNPFTGLLSNYDVIIQRLADFHKNSYDCQGLDGLGLDCDTYDGLRVTAYAFDWNSKALL